MKKIVFNQNKANEIVNDYISLKKTTKELASENNCSIDTIYRLLHESEISVNPRYRHKDLVGQKFGMLTVISFDEIRYLSDLKKTSKPHLYWNCKCECGRIKNIEGGHLISGHTISCGCVKSCGEKLISKILKEHEIDFKVEIYFDDLRGIGGGLLRFDFGIYNNKKLAYLIEFNGEQHYRITGGWCNKREFTTRQENDKLKIEYCKANKIPLIVIPYKHINKLCISDLDINKTKFLVGGKE